MQTTVSRDIARARPRQGAPRERPARLRAARRRRAWPARTLSAALARWALAIEPSGQPRRRHDAARLRERARPGDRRRAAPAHRRDDRGREHRAPRRARAVHRRRARRGDQPASAAREPHERRRRAARTSSSARCRSASASASRSPAASTRAARSPGCASTARSRTRSPPTSASTTSPTSPPSPSAPAATARRRRCSSTAGGARARGARRAAVRRLPHPDRRPPLLQHDAARPRRHRDAARARDGAVRRRHLGRRLDVQGQRHRALLSLRAAREREPADLQAVARRRVRLGARRPHGDERMARRARPAARQLDGEGVLDRREPARRDARGEGSRAALDEHEDRRADHGRRALGSAVEIEPEIVTVAFEAGVPVALDGVEIDDPVDARSRGERDRRPARARHVRPDREPHHRGEEPRHLRGARHGAPAHRVRAPADARSTTRRRSSATRSTAAGSGDCSTRAAGSIRRR